MYVDIVGFQYKADPYVLATTPKARSWRKKTESLRVTRKGSKEGQTCLRFLVGISYDAGVTLVAKVPEGMNGHYYARMISENHFEGGLKECRRLLQDNDTVQNSKVAQKAFAKKKISLVAIPPRSPDINVIENLFNTAKREQHKMAKDNKIRKETKLAFEERIEGILNAIPTRAVNNLIDSLPKRIDGIIKEKGCRLKY